MRSIPALQNAETEWNTAIQIPRKGPKSRLNTGMRRSAPISSTVRATFTIKPVRRTIPRICGAETDSAMILRWESPIFFPEMIVKDAEIVTTPRPPIWIRRRITACPKVDQ